MISSYYSHLWAVIHLSALNFKRGDDSEIEYKNFYESLSPTLGCKPCIEHYKKFVLECPPDFEDLFGWTVKLHNSVNQTRGDPTFTREESLKYWSSL